METTNIDTAIDGQQNEQGASKVDVGLKIKCLIIQNILQGTVWVKLTMVFIP